MVMKKASIPGINQRLEGCVEEVDGHEEDLYTWHKPEAGRLSRGSRWP